MTNDNQRPKFSNMKIQILQIKLKIARHLYYDINWHIWEHWNNLSKILSESLVFAQLSAKSQKHSRELSNNYTFRISYVQCGQKGRFIPFWGIFGLKGGSNFWRWGFVGLILKWGFGEFPKKQEKCLVLTKKVVNFVKFTLKFSFWKIFPKRNRFFKNWNFYTEIFFSTKL